MITKEERVKKAAEITTVLENIKASDNYSIQLDDFMNNLKYFIEDFKNEKVEPIKDWLDVYDAQSQFTEAYPVALMTIVLHPNYLPVYQECFEKEFNEIKKFVEYVRKTINE